MAKYSRDLKEELVQKVQEVSREFGLREQGIRVEAVRVDKCKTYGQVLKSNEIVKLFTGEDNVIAVALYEEVFDQLNEQAQTILIHNLLEQVFVNQKEDGTITIKIEKPQLNLGLRTFNKFGNVATQMLEAVILTIDQVEEEKKAEKEAQKQSKKKKKGVF